MKLSERLQKILALPPKNPGCYRLTDILSNICEHDFAVQCWLKSILPDYSRFVGQLSVAVAVKTPCSPMSLTGYLDCLETFDFLHAARIREAGHGNDLQPEHVILYALRPPQPNIMSLTQVDKVTFQEFSRARGLFHSNFKNTIKEPDVNIDASVKNDSGWAPLQSPILNQYCVDYMTRVRNEFTPPVVGRETQIQDVVVTLLKHTKANPILVGEPGVGKTAIVEKLAHLIMSKDPDIPEKLHNKRILELSIPRLLANTQYRGQLEKNMSSLLTECEKFQNEIILFIDEIHVILSAGDSVEGGTVGGYLKPALARPGFFCIGATTRSEYRRFFEQDEALNRRFRVVTVPEPTVSETIDIMGESVPRLAAYHTVNVDPDFIVNAVNLTERYVPHKYQPDKTFDIIDETFARVQLKPSTQGTILRKQLQDAITVQDLGKQYKILQQIQNLPAPTVTVDDVAVTLEAYTGVPVVNRWEERIDYIRGIESQLSGRVIGQQGAVVRVCAAMRGNLMGFTKSTAPLSFIFAGRSGVGKTELARQLAAARGNKRGFLKIDGGEFGNEHNVSRLIGSPPGYVGFGAGGVLTEHVTAHPYSVIVFDEMEKAHPRVLDIFLSILDTGETMDAQGRRVSFRDAIIIFTTNLGASVLNKKFSLGFNNSSQVDMVKIVKNELKTHCRIELLNRITDVIVFNNLTPEIVKQLFRNRVDYTVACAANIGVTVTVADSVTDWLYTMFEGDACDARAVDRMVRENVDDKLTAHIVTQATLLGEVFVTIANNVIDFTSATASKVLVR